MGYITDAHTNAPVAYGSVCIEELDMKTDITQSGTFRFKSIPEGKFRLKIENLDYTTLFVNITRYAPEHCKLNLKMHPVPFEEAQAVL